LLGCFAEFETNLRKERQAEGIAKAKAAGIYKGTEWCLVGLNPSGGNAGRKLDLIANTLKRGRVAF
jgi:DNA invertase Pin-like site-specific DNA recombinase